MRNQSKSKVGILNIIVEVVEVVLHAFVFIDLFLLGLDLLFDFLLLLLQLIVLLFEQLVFVFLVDQVNHLDNDLLLLHIPLNIFIYFLDGFDLKLHHFIPAPRLLNLRLFFQKLKSVIDLLQVDFLFLHFLDVLPKGLLGVFQLVHFNVHGQGGSQVVAD